MDIKISFLGMLLILFIGLKLGEVIGWSWWLVLLPIYAVGAIVVVLFIFAFLVACLITLIDR